MFRPIKFFRSSEIFSAFILFQERYSKKRLLLFKHPKLVGYSTYKWYLFNNLKSPCYICSGLKADISCSCFLTFRQGQWPVASEVLPSSLLEVVSLFHSI